MRWADLIVKYLVRKNVKQVFGIIGSSNAHLFDAFRKQGIPVTCLHHEQACVMAAGAYFKTTGTPAVVLVAAGGGAMNALTGVAGLWADSIPCMIFSGQENSAFLTSDDKKRMYGMQGVRGNEIVKTITKYSEVFASIDQLETAWFHMSTGRKGPVWFDVPMNIQSQEVIPEHLIQSSKKPVIIAGHGVKLSGAVDKLQNVKAPILTTWSSIDIPHPLKFGCAGIYGNRCANKILQASDLLIVLGSRLSIMQTGYDLTKFAPSAQIVMVNIDNTDFKGNINVKADCGDVIECLNFSVDDWIEECRALQTKYPILEHKDENGYTNSYKFIHDVLSPKLTNEIVVTDMGTALISGHNTIRLTPENTMFTSYGLGEMGYGLPAAIGAAVAAPDRPVVCLNCDGSMMMNLQELQTIKANNLNIKIIIFNNDGYLSIKHTQKMFKCEQFAVDEATGVHIPDYNKVCAAFDIPVYREGPDCLLVNEAFNEFMRVKGPAMYQVFMDPHQPFTPKVQARRGEDGKIIPGTLDEMC